MCGKPGFVGQAHHGLTPRQWDVAEQLYLGKTNKEISAALGISPKTVKFHCANINAVLGTTSRIQVALKMIEFKRLDATSSQSA